MWTLFGNPVDVWRTKPKAVRIQHLNVKRLPLPHQYTIVPSRDAEPEPEPSELGQIPGAGGGVTGRFFSKPETDRAGAGMLLRIRSGYRSRVVFSRQQGFGS